MDKATLKASAIVIMLFGSFALGYALIINFIPKPIAVVEAVPDIVISVPPEAGGDVRAWLEAQAPNVALSVAWEWGDDSVRLIDGVVMVGLREDGMVVWKNKEETE